MCLAGLVACSPVPEDTKAPARGRARTDASAIGDSTKFGDPTALMREYVRRDAAGQRLAANNWFPAVATWEDEPGWDEYTVIAGYDVMPTRTAGDSSSVSVVYQRIGRMTQSGGHGLHFVPGRAADTVLFHLVRTAGNWKIASPQINQHVAARSLLNGANLPMTTRQSIEEALLSTPE